MSEEKADGSGSGSAYEKLEKNKNENFARTSRQETFSELCLPEDNYNLVYVSFIFGGMGFLIPYNSFIMATDYFKNRFPDSPVVFDMSLVYIVTALVTVMGNTMLVDVFSMNCRIKLGYLISFLTLSFVVTFEIYCDLALQFTSSYTANLIAVAIVAVGCTIQQSSFYGYTGMLPPKYIHAVMVGESIAGVLTSITRLATRFFIRDLRVSTITFFMISLFFLGFCCVLYPRIRKSDFVQFYLGLCERDKTKITLEPREDAGLIEICDSRYGILKIQTSPPPASSNIMSFANPVYEPNDQTSKPTYKVEDVLFTGRRISQGSRMDLSSFKEGLRARWTVTRTIYPYMVTIFLVYFTTLCLYPGVASEVVSCYMGHWMPMFMMIDFNCADLIGKMVAHRGYWPGTRLLKCSIARLILIPLMVLCVMPFWHSNNSDDLFSFAYSILLGLTNGMLGSIPMIQAPTKVARCYRELAGNMMTLFYMWGLATGSLGAYALERLIRPLKAQNCCDYRYHRVDPFKPYLTQNHTIGEMNVTTVPSVLITTILSTITGNVTDSM